MLLLKITLALHGEHFSPTDFANKINDELNATTGDNNTLFIEYKNKIGVEYELQSYFSLYTNFLMEQSRLFIKYVLRFCGFSYR